MTPIPSRGVTTMPPAPPPSTRSDQLRELLGLVLLIAGFVALAVVAFLVDYRAGIATLAGAALVGGYRLTVREI